jgi:hypothetical protein
VEQAITIGAAAFAIFATIISGAVWVVTIVGRVAARVKEQDINTALLDKRLATVEKDVKDHEKKNSILRHDFTTVTNSVYDKIDRLENTLTDAIDKGFIHVKELFDTQIKNLKEKFDEKK